MMKISHGLEYIPIWTLSRLARLLSPGMADQMAVALGRLSHRVLTSRRRITRDNLRKAFKNQFDDRAIDRITKEVFINVARTSVEFARQPVMKLDEIARMTTSVGRENLDRVLSEGKGGILVSPHFGNWELFGGWIAACGYPVDFLIGEQHNPLVDKLLISFRDVFGANIIQVGLTSRHVIKSLRANRLVAVASDQHAASGGVIVEFFGRKASTPKGPAAFAVKVGCPIIPLLYRRESYKQYHAVVSSPIYPMPSGDPDDDIIRMTQAYTSVFENHIRQYPSQWMWTHRRWKLD